MLFDVLKRKQKEHIEKVDKICNGHLKGIWAEKDHVVRMCSSIQSAIDVTQRNLECANVKLLGMSNHIMARLRELNKAQWDKTQTEK